MENLRNVKYYKSNTWAIKHVGVQLKQCINFLSQEKEISPDIPDRQNETHDGRTYGSKRHPYMANTDRIPRNSYMENATCS